MSTSQFAGNFAARDNPAAGIQYVAGRYTLISAGNPAAVKIGRMPAGAMVLGIHSRVLTAVTGGTPVLGVGTAANLVGTNGNLNAVMAEAAGSEILAPNTTLAQPLVADTDIWVGTTGGASAGDVLVAVAYILPITTQV
jgi:hypothetical protein